MKNSLCQSVGLTICFSVQIMSGLQLLHGTFDLDVIHTIIMHDPLPSMCHILTKGQISEVKVTVHVQCITKNLRVRP